MRTLLWVAVGLLVTACGDLAGEPRIVSTLPPAPTVVPTQAEADLSHLPQLVRDGAAIYAANCTACHGIDGSGNGELVQSEEVPHPGDMTDRDAVAIDTPELWFNTVTNGNLANLMPPWGNALTTEERWAVTLYSYTRSYTPQRMARGEAVWADIDGIDVVTDTAAMIALSDADVFEQLAEQVEDEADRWAAVAYARTLSLQADGAIETLVAQAQPSANGDEVPAGAEVALEPIVADVVGQVLNGTADAALPDDLTVTLYEVDASFRTVSTQEAQTDADGNFTFADMTIQPEMNYVVGTIYEDRPFFGDVQPGAGVTEDGLDLRLTIYEITNDASVISIDRIAYQVTGRGENLQILEVVFFENSSDRAFSAEQPLAEGVYGSVIVETPPGAVILGFGDNSRRYVESPDEFLVVDTQMVLPGNDHNIQLVYALPYNADGAVIEHPLNYALDGNMQLLVNPTTLDVVSEQLPPLGIETIGSNEYATYGGVLEVPAGGAVRYEVSGSLNPTQLVTDQRADYTLPIVLFAISGAAGLGAVALFFVGRRSSSNIDRQIDALVRQIAALDDDHERGQLNHDVWHKQRNELKAKLAELMAERDGS